MKITKTFTLTTLIGFSCFSFLVTKTSARIGDTRTTIQKRLFSSGGAEFREESSVNNKTKGMPYAKYEEFFPKSTEIRVYHKTTDGSHSKLLGPGWELHVLYVNGVSELEIYKKSQKITEFEMIYLLNFQSSSSYWKKSQESESPTEELSAFGFDFIRDDEKVKAKKLGGNSFMVYSTELDKGFAEAMLADLKALAPQSVEGF